MPKAVAVTTSRFRHITAARCAMCCHGSIHMPASLPAYRRSSLSLAFFAFVLALTGGSATAFADDTFSSHPLDSVLKALDLKTDVGKSPDFVEQSRPKTEMDFVPVGQPHPTRSVKVKTPAELKAMESELDTARIHQDKISGRKPPQPKPAKKTEAKAQQPAPAATQN